MTLHQILKYQEEAEAKFWESFFTERSVNFVFAVGLMFSLLIGLLFYKLACIFIKPTLDVLLDSVSFALLIFAVILIGQYKKFRKNLREKIERSYQ